MASAGNTGSSTRTRKEKRLTYVLNCADDGKVKYSVGLCQFNYSSLCFNFPDLNVPFKLVIF